MAKDETTPQPQEETDEQEESPNNTSEEVPEEEGESSYFTSILLTLVLFDPFNIIRVVSKMDKLSEPAVWCHVVNAEDSR